jgi:tRNA dimethylallyltransferase
VPARWDEACRRHRELLELAPTRVASIRALARIAQGRQDEEAASNGVALLRALGVASAEERDAAPARLRLSVGGASALEPVGFERVRAALREVANELGDALESGPAAASAETPRARFRELALRAEGELCAPAIVTLDAAGIREVAIVLSGLVHDRDAVAGGGDLVNRLSSALGWRARRRLAKRFAEVTPEEVADLDFRAFREELRALAHATALDASGGDLRGALVALLEDARRAAARIHARGIPIFLVGGTGLYIRAMCEGLVGAGGADPVLRQRLEREHVQAVAAGDPLRLHRRLAERDAAAARAIHPNDVRRLVRALELCARFGEASSRLRGAHGFGDRPYRVLHLALDPGREALDARIDARCAAMIDAGLLREVRRLRERGYGPELRTMQSIGYRHMQPVADGLDTLVNALAAMRRDTRQFARRQRTWLRGVPEAIWLVPEDDDAIMRTAERFLAHRSTKDATP